MRLAPSVFLFALAPLLAVGACTTFGAGEPTPDPTVPDGGTDPRPLPSVLPVPDGATAPIDAAPDVVPNGRFRCGFVPASPACADYESNSAAPEVFVGVGSNTPGPITNGGALPRVRDGLLEIAAADDTSWFVQVPTKSVGKGELVIRVAKITAEDPLPIVRIALGPDGSLGTCELRAGKSQVVLAGCPGSSGNATIDLKTPGAFTLTIKSTVVDVDGDAIIVNLLQATALSFGLSAGDSEDAATIAFDHVYVKP